MKNLQISILQKRKEKYLKLQDRFLKSLKKGDFESKNGRSKQHWIEKLKKLEKQLGLASNLKLKHWALAFALGFVTIVGNAQDKKKAALHPHRQKTEIQKSRTQSNARVEAVSLFSEQPVLGDGLTGDEQFVGDFDGDGDDDLMVFSYSGPLKIFVNNSGDLRTKVEVFNSSYGVNGYTAGDIDGDGDLDIILIEENQSNQSRFTYLINEGGNVFTPASAAFGARKYGPHLNDIDNDGDLDILVNEDVGGYYYELKILSNNGALNFTQSASLNFIGTSDIQIGTFTSDALPDIAVSTSDSLKVFVNSAGSFTSGNFVSTVLGTYNNRLGATGDIDADGDLDMLLYDNRLSILVNNGTGAFTETLIKDDPLDTYLVWFDPIIADFNGDANLDVLTWEVSQNNIAGAGAKIFTGDGANNFSELPQTVQMTTGTDYSAGLQIIDFDGDGDEDLILSSYTEMEVFQNDGLANFTSFDDQLVNVFYGYSELVDLDGDSDLDAILSFTDRVLINDGVGNFSEGQELPTTSSYYYLATGDFDNDSDIDVAYQNDDAGNEFVVWTNNGAATFAVGSSFAPVDSNDNIRGMAAGDLSGDSIADIVTIVKNDTSGVSSIDLWTNNGDASFVQTRTASSNKLEKIKLADIDGDGDLDVITKAEDYNYQSLGLSVYTNNAGALAQSVFLVSPDAGFRFSEGFTAGDIDGDGDMDIVALDTYNNANKVSLFTNNGVGVFANSIIATTSGAYGEMVLEDFDLDGDIDLFVGGNDSQDEIWVNDGIGNFSLLGTLDSKSYSVRTGDIDGDGDKDLFTLEYYQGNRFIINNTNAPELVSPLEQDSLVLVQFYNETGGGSWTNRSGWLADNVSTWFGVTVTAERVTSLVLENNNLTGAFTITTGLDSLAVLDLSGNALTGIPDLSSSNFTTLDVSANNLQFGALEANAAIPGINYSNQSVVGTPIIRLVPEFATDTLFAEVSGTANMYQWYKDNVSIGAANTSALAIGSFTFADNGDYHCEVTNSIATGLTISTADVTWKMESKLELDSIQLVQLYNETGGANWTNNSGWLVDNVVNWFGVTVTNDRVSSIILNNNNLTGAITVNQDLDELLTLDVSGNAITSIPDWTGTSMTTIDVSDNNLDFGSLEANAGIAGINYANQGLIGTQMTDSVMARTSYDLNINTPGSSNMYQWFKDGVSISGAIDTTYTIASVKTIDIGNYYCEVTNDVVTGLTLTSEIQRVEAFTTVSGKVMLDDTNPLTSGEILLLGITPTEGYDTLSAANIGADGVYTHSLAPLGDYITLAKPDTLSFSNYLPTYWGELTNSFLWEEADTIQLDSAIIDLNINLIALPTDMPAGQGLIGGYLEEEVPDGGRIEAKKRVAGAGVSVSRGNKQGKGEEDEYILVAYLYTNAQGEFNFENLEEDVYRLNIQYPGYPMDPNSFIDITVGSGSNGNVSVAAVAEGGKIVVTDVTVTSIFENSNYPGLKIYPNPTNQYLFIDADEFRENKLELLLIDAAGKEMKRENVNAKMSKTEGMDISALKNGVYILQVYNGDKELLKSVRVVISEK